jgi:type II secretory pathway component PulF
LHSKPEYPVHLFVRVRVADKSALFQQVHALLAAGVLLPEALSIVAQQTRHAILEEIMHQVTARVQGGEALSHVARDYPMLYDSLTIQLLSVGEQSGRLALVLQAIVRYLQVKQDFHASIRAALFMPFMTLLFFFAVMTLLFTVVIPRFAQMFASLGQELPPLTRGMIAVSDFMVSAYMIWAIVGLVGIVAAVRAVARTTRGQVLSQRVLLATPGIGSLLYQQALGYFFESVSLLLASGMPLVSALSAVSNTIPYLAVRERMEKAISEVRHGQSLAQALGSFGKKHISSDIIAIIRVGQEIGALDGMLKQVAGIYQSKVKRTLAFVTMIIQPLLIVILGLLILLLIVAVYTPILHLSYAV